MNNNNAQTNFWDVMTVGGRPIVSPELFDYLTANGFFMKPASISHHGNFTGGLFQHSLAVTENLVEMTEKLNIQWTRPESPYIVGMFHDLCKMDDYCDKNAKGTVLMGTGEPISNDPQWTRNTDCILKGHGDKSVMMLSQFMTLTEEEMFCIKFHMGAYETGEWDAFDKAIRKYESVLWTHTADMYASKVQDI